jgi:hypothetical protein
MKGLVRTFESLPPIYLYGRRDRTIGLTYMSVVINIYMPLSRNLYNTGNAHGLLEALHEGTMRLSKTVYPWHLCPVPF